MPKSSADYDLNVFINCPFDDEYRPLFEAIVFAVQIAGFNPRCALEASKAGPYRLSKIMSIIFDCKYGIHDISRTELNNKGLPRFNMPLELGIDLGCQTFGANRQRLKKFLILDRSKHRYKEFISDISGQDVEAHSKSPKLAIRRVRDWLRAESNNSKIPGGDYMYKRYQTFQKALPRLCQELKLDLKTLPFVDFAYTVRIWLEENEV